MSLGNSEARYGAVAMAFHWLIAALILLNVTLAIWFNEIMDRHEAMRFTVVQTHKSIGLTVLVLSVLRLVWRILNPPPPMPADMGKGRRLLAHATHWALYFLMISVPLLGWMLVSASRTGVPTLYFGEIPWPNLSFIADLPRAQKIEVGHIYENRHMVTAYLLLALVVAHAAAAIYHHVIRRDTVLKRMLPGTNVRLS